MMFSMAVFLARKALSRRQLMYFVSMLAMWQLVFLLYSALWWAIPLGYWEIMGIFLVLSVIFGIIYMKGE
jgi:hypothetical protein